MAVTETIKVSKNNRAQWLSLNPILADKEVGVEKDTNFFKVGDGVNHWNNLAYVLSGYQNALFISLSNDASNIISLTSDGSIILHKSFFNGASSYNLGKVEGAVASIPSDDYQATILRIGQDVKEILFNIEALKTRTTAQEGKDVGDSIADSLTNNINTWSSNKIVDRIVAEIASLRSDITNNSSGAYDALVRLASLLEDNPSLATAFAQDLGNTIRFNEEQSLTELQKTQARTNIGAVGVSDLGNVTGLIAAYELGFTDISDSPFRENEA